jgi:DNA-binding NtrC family response regulator
MTRVLVADDELMDRQLIQETLLTIDEGLQVTTACDGEEACRLLDQDQFDLVFTDMKMPKKDGLAVLEKAKSSPTVRDVVVITGFGDVRTAVEAMKKGCFDYLMKPICVEQVEELFARMRGISRGIPGKPDKSDGIIGESLALKESCRRAMHVGSTDATVLLQGESGTGKELVSRLVHESSPRKDKPFIRVNCAALSETILESELFGHEKGAFTGAHISKPGRFELAAGGTLLLDEISETSDKLQAELLRVIEQKEFERVGGTRTIKVDVRIIATTNRDLAEEVAEGKFREDLYYRLNVVPLVLPPLRERQGDVEILTHHFAGRFAKKLGKACPKFTREALQGLNGYSWPGNVRELENLVHRLVIMDTNGLVDASDLPDYLARPVAPTQAAPTASTVATTLDDIEKDVILRTLQQVNGNRTLAAEKLNISTRTIRNKLHKYAAQAQR